QLPTTVGQKDVTEDPPIHVENHTFAGGSLLLKRLPAWQIVNTTELSFQAGSNVDTVHGTCCIPGESCVLRRIKSNRFIRCTMDLLHVLEEEFHSVDTDKDGFLNKAEIGTCLEKFGFQKERAAVSGNMQFCLTESVQAIDVSFMFRTPI
ncbi:hypothetical protein AHF37_04622, partial [Paragonimus kellicotti]